MPTTLAFDVYGTLIDTQGLVSSLRRLIGDKAAAFSQTWRDKQLEYSFRRGLMQKYQNFAVCTAHALDYACAFYDAPLDQGQKRDLLQRYRVLPAFAEVKDGLAQLQADDFRLFAFSNGGGDAVEDLLVAADIRRFFLGIVSVDDIRSFKPDPAVYRHFLKKAAATADDTWLISSNPFDVIGAVSAGLRAAWLRRAKNAVFDPWEVEATAQGDSILDIAQKLRAWRTAQTAARR